MALSLKRCAKIRTESDDLLSRFNALRAAKDENDGRNSQDISSLENRLAASEADRASLSRSSISAIRLPKRSGFGTEPPRY
jgi:hypothetical protein